MAVMDGIFRSNSHCRMASSLPSLKARRRRVTMRELLAQLVIKPRQATCKVYINKEIMVRQKERGISRINVLPG